MTDLQKELEALEKKQKNFGKAILGVGIIGVILLPIILTQPAINSWFDLSKYGNIGSTIGGTTAPLVGLATAILMYYAFSAQWKANRIQFDELVRNRHNETKEMVWKMYESTQRDISNSTFYDLKKNILNEKIEIIYKLRDIVFAYSLMYDSFVQIQRLHVIMNGVKEGIIGSDYTLMFNSQILHLYNRFKIDYHQINKYEADIKNIIKSVEYPEIKGFTNLIVTVEEKVAELDQLFKDKAPQPIG